MSEYTDDNKSLLGINDSTTLNQLIDDGLVPQNSICRLWINDNSTYGSEVRSALNALFHKSIYGYLTITRNQNTRHLRIQAYDTLDTYETTYTEINDAGWYRTWLQTAGVCLSKIHSITSYVTFTDSKATITHNFGFTDQHSYRVFAIPYGVQFVVTGIYNIDGNTIEIFASNYNENGVLTTLGGSFYMNLLYVGL